MKLAFDNLLKKKFPDFSDLFDPIKKVILTLLLLSPLLATSFSLAVATLSDLATEAQFFGLEGLSFQHERILIFVFSFFSFSLFLSESMGQVSGGTRNLHRKFLLRFCEQIEARFLGEISDRALSENIQNLFQSSKRWFRFFQLFLSLISLSSFSGFFILLGLALKIPATPYFLIVGFLLASCLLLLGSAIWLRTGFSKFMEDFQETYRNLSIETKYLFHLPSGNMDVPKIDGANGTNSYFQFFELSQSHESHPVFKNFSFTLPTQKVISVCASKEFQESALHSLLFRWKDPDLGQIRLFKNDLRNYKREGRQKHFRASKNCNFLLPLNTRDNLTIFCKDVPDDSTLQKAIEFAGLRGRLPKNLNTPIVGNRSHLSRMDQFRLSIARLWLLKDAQVFYLYSPYLGLLEHERAEASKLLKKLAQDRQIVFLVSDTREEDQFSDYVFFFPLDKNPVLSTAKELHRRQSSYSKWNQPSDIQRTLEIQFETESGQPLTLRWEILPGKLQTLWWHHLWETLGQTQIGFEQRFFGWRTEEKYQEKRANLLNTAIRNINKHFQEKYSIPQLAHSKMEQNELNQLHHHFENLMGQSWNPSPFLQNLPQKIHDSIRALNDLVHDFEYSSRTQNAPHGHRVVSGFQFRTIPYHQQLIPEDCFSEFTFENQAGDIVTDYCQLGKNWSEVCEDNDEHIKQENISPLRFFSSSFICNFHDLPSIEAEQLKAKVIAFIDKKRLLGWNVQGTDPKNALGHIPLARLRTAPNNRTPNQSEFSQITQIRSITLRQDDRFISKELPNFVPYYENLQDEK